MGRWLILLLVVAASPGWGDAISRLTAVKLKAVHEGVVALEAQKVKVATATGFDDAKAIMHCHSKWSHDSRGTIEEITEAAKKTGVRVILFTEHPADHYDFVTDGHQGMREGILFVPGAELNGMLAYPLSSLKGLSFQSPQEQSDMIKRTGGLAFYCHLEERMDWAVQGISGTEIYNVHADAKEEARLFLGLVNPLFWLQIRPLLAQYPQEVYASLQDYPKDYLKRYDELCQMFPHTGVAGNDSHHNIGVKIIRGAKDVIRVEDALGETLANLEISKLPFLAPLAGKAKEGDVILHLDMDPYERAFRHVGTHLLLKEFSRAGVWEALEAGRVFVGFDWVSDTTGFNYRVENGGKSEPVGTKTAFAEGMELVAEAPLASCVYKLVKDGEIFHEVTGSALRLKAPGPGIYRVECWVKVGEEDRPWILSNPIYLRPAGG